MRFLILVLCCLSATEMVGAQGTRTQQAESAWKILMQGVSEKNPEKRRETIVAVSLMGAQDEAYYLLSSALEDKDVPVRVAACASLAALKEKRSIPLLKKALNDEVPEVSFSAAKALWEMNDPAGKEVLLAVLEGEKKYKSGFITTQKRDAMRLMKNPGALFKLALKEGVGFIPLPGLGTGVASLEALLSNSGLSGKAIAALLMAQDKEDDSLEVLCDALDDRDWGVRASAIHSIALRNKPEVRSQLVDYLEDKKDAVRYRAAAAYLRLEWLAKDSQTPTRRK